MLSSSGANPLPESCSATDSLGRFWFADPEWDRAQLLASASGHLPRRISWARAAFAPGTALEITLDEAEAEISGTVSDAQGGVVPGSLVSAESGEDKSLVAFGLTDSDGRFAFAIGAGVVHLRADADGYSRASREISAPARGIDLVLAAESMIAGHIRERGTTRPVAGAEVRATELGGARAPTQTLHSDAEGNFEFRSLSGGEYELVALAPFWRTERAVVRVGVGERLDAVELVASPATTLTGQVQLGDVPCGAGSVEISGPTRDQKPTRADGSVRFDGLVPGKYLVSYRCTGESEAPGAQSASVGAEAFVDVSEQPISLVWKLSRAPAAEPQREAGAAAARVTIRNGGDVTNQFSAFLVSAEGRVSRSGQVQENSIIFSELPLGHYTAYLEQAPAIHTDVVLAVQGETVETTLTAPVETVVQGRVLGPDDIPAPDTWVRAYNAEFPSAAFAAAGSPALTDSQGEFTIRGLFSTTYDLAAEGPEGRAVLAGVRGGTRTIRLTLLGAPD